MNSGQQDENKKRNKSTPSDKHHVPHTLHACSAYPGFQVDGEPVGNVDHFEVPLDFFLKVHLPPILHLLRLNQPDKQFSVFQSKN